MNAAQEIIPKALFYLPNFLESQYAEELLNRSLKEIPWKTEEIKLFGKQFLQPRLIYFTGQPNLVYTYSNKPYPTEALPEFVAPLWKEVNEFCQQAFNTILINRYRDGQDSMGWHADNEPELGLNPTVASFTLGEERMFRIKAKTGGKSLGLHLEHNSLLIMKNSFQHEFLHSLPKSKKRMSERVNFTFREIKKGAE